MSNFFYFGGISYFLNAVRLTVSLITFLSKNRGYKEVAQEIYLYFT